MAQISSGISGDLMYGQGGIQSLWVFGGTGASAGITQITTSTGATYAHPPALGYPAVNITGVTAIGGSGTWYAFALPKFTANVQTVTTPSEANGSNPIVTTFTFVIQHSSESRTGILNTLSQNRYVRFIYMDNYGNQYFVGWDRGAVVKTITNTSGTADTDGDTYTIVLEHRSPNPPLQLTRDITLACSSFTVQQVTIQEC